MSEREITSSDEQIRSLLLDGSVDDRLHIYRKLRSLSLSLTFRAGAGKSAFEDYRAVMKERCVPFRDIR